MEILTTEYRGYQAIRNPETEQQTGFLDTATGEVLPAIQLLVPAGTRVVPPVENERRRYYAELREAQARQERYRAAALTNNTPLGSFFTAKYDRQKCFTDIKPETLMRLFYLATYLDYDSRLMTRQRIPMTSRSMRELLELPKTTFYTFRDEVLHAGYLIQQGEHFSIRRDLLRGSTGITGYEGGKTKVYFNGLRSLYHAIRPSQHRYAGYLFQVMPHINIRFNVLSQDVFEEAYG